MYTIAKIQPVSDCIDIAIYAYIDDIDPQILFSGVVDRSAAYPVVKCLGDTNIFRNVILVDLPEYASLFDDTFKVSILSEIK